MNQLINYKAVYRTAPATLGLLITDSSFVNVSSRHLHSKNGRAREINF